MDYKIGMYGGSFNPLHIGHINNIITASNLCEKLYIVISVTNDPKEIDFHERYMWLKTVTKSLENIEIITIFDKNINKETYDWNTGANDIKKHIKNKIDVVFSGDDYIDRNIWETLYQESKIYYIPRSNLNISSTEIRNNPYNYFDYIPTCVKMYYTKKICIIGTESTGKTTLAKNLALYYNTSCVEEVGRLVCDEAGGIDNMQEKHYFDILLKHKQLEGKMIDKSNKILLIDTDSNVTLYYYKLAFNKLREQDNKFEEIASLISYNNKYDLYLFLEPDVPWVQDGTRTYGETEVREKNNKLLKDILTKNNVDFYSISGNYNERYTKAKKLIDELF